MAMELSGASSSSSAPRKHGVFLSFYGKDTGTGFAFDLYDALVRAGLNVYRDDELQFDNILLQKLLQAKLAVLILSENYTDSTWHLDELVKIVECVETRDLIPFPVFYGVDSSDVRRQTNKFDLAIHERNSGIAKDRMDSWRSALEKVGNTTGLHVKGERTETEYVREIVRKIHQELEQPSPTDLDVGKLEYDILEDFDSEVYNMVYYLCSEHRFKSFWNICFLYLEEAIVFFEEKLQIPIKYSIQIAEEFSGASSSSSSAPRKYDVFLSFRGKDTRYGITGNLYDDLVKRGLKAFRDDEDLEIGKPTQLQLLKAIEESKSAIVILSENYAGSTWCLDELVKIVECAETRDLILYPVFYRVDPSDVRGQREKFDLTKYEENPGIAKEKVDSWKRALFTAGNSTGLHVKWNRYEIYVRHEIIDKISEKLRNLESPKQGCWIA